MNAIDSIANCFAVVRAGIRTLALFPYHEDAEDYISHMLTLNPDDRADDYAIEARRINFPHWD